MTSNLVDEPNRTAALSDQQPTGHASFHVHTTSLVTGVSLLSFGECGTISVTTGDQLRTFKRQLNTFLFGTWLATAQRDCFICALNYFYLLTLFGFKPRQFCGRIFAKIRSLVFTWAANRQTNTQTDKRLLLHNLLGGGNRVVAHARSRQTTAQYQYSWTCGPTAIWINSPAGCGSYFNESNPGFSDSLDSCIQTPTTDTDTVHRSRQHSSLSFLPSVTFSLLLTSVLGIATKLADFLTFVNCNLVHVIIRPAWTRNSFVISAVASTS